MKICWAIILAISFITAHDPNKENIQWTQYYRLGSVYSKTLTNGIAESQWNFKKRIEIITGFTCDAYNKEPSYSFFLTISFCDPINWKI